MKRKEFIKKTGAGMLGISTAPVLVSNPSDQHPNAEETTGNSGTVIHKCKITVLRREFHQDLAVEYVANPDVGPCEVFHDGQEFILDSGDYFHMLSGKFCAEAWDAIHRYVYAALQGGSIMRGWTKDEKVMITCCNDGVRPVVFKIERIDFKQS